MKKCIVEVIFKDGQKMQTQVDFLETESHTEYKAFDEFMPVISKIHEIKFVRMV